MNSQTMQLQISLDTSFDDRTASSWSRKERQKWFLSLLCGTCLIYATRTSVPLLIPVVSQEKNWSKSDSGIILSSFFWGYTLTQVASGYISDKIGGQRVLWISALGWSATTFLMPEIIEYFSGDGTSILLVAAVRMINGAFQGMHFPSMISLISQRLHEAERASFFSLLTSGSALGTLLTGSLGSYLLENYNWMTVFRALGGMSLAWTALLSYHTLPFKEKTASIKSTTDYTLPWSKLLSQPPFWSCVIGHACQNNCFFVLLSWMPTYFHDTFPEIRGWIVNMVPWLSMLPCTFLGKALSEEIIKAGYSVTVTRKTIQTICFVIEIGSLLFLAKVESFENAILCLALIIGGSGFHNNAIAVNPSDLAPKHSGSVFGLMNTVGAIPEMSQDEEVDSQTSQWYGVREATLFLVDCTKKMFMHSSDIDDKKITYIEKFFKLYKQILRQKLAWSMQDWMGVVLFGTEKSDSNSPWTNIQTLQELRVVTLDDLQQIRKLIKSGMKGYESMKLKNNVLLLDALTYATDIFLKIKTVLTKRRIVLITCYDPDYSDDEKHRIRAKAKSLKELDINLHVIDLRNNWPLDEFYKDLEMLSRKIEISVYRRTSLVDLVQQIKAPSKNIARLSFQICDGVEIDLVVRTLGRKRRYLQTKPLSKATNQVLSRSTYFKDTNFSIDEEDSDNEESDLPFMIPEEVNLETKELIGGKKLRFTRKELLRIKHLYPPAIKIIGVRPIPSDLFRYHVKRKYFVRADYGSTRKDNLLFFSALLNKCATKNKMIVCAFTMRLNTQTNLCYMIPNAELGGFYLSKVAFQGNVGDKSEALLHYDTQNSVSDKEVALWKKTIDRLDMNYHPYNFRSYKLECQIQIVEKLALDKEPGPPPIDSIEKSYLIAKQKTSDLISEFYNMYPDLLFVNGPTKAKRTKKK